jgi:hypothetical protein
MEIWKDVVGYEGYYKVSNLGRVKSLDRIVKHSKEWNQKKKGKIIKLAKRPNGYIAVGLSKNGKVSQMYVHRLVAEAFLPNSENKEHVDHINTIRDDNRADNLRWTTRKENANNPMTIEKYKECNKGERNPWYGRNARDMKTTRPVVQLTLDGKLVKVWDSTRQTEKEGFRHSEVSAVCRGYRGAKTHKGFLWMYEDEYLKSN